MNTEELLEKIGNLLEAEREHTRKIVREVVDVNNKVLGTIVKVELAVSNNKIDAVTKDTKALKKGQERIEQKLETIITDHEDRITTVEHELFH